MITNDDRIEWIKANVTYLENRIKGVESRAIGKGAYWPQDSNEDHFDTVDPDCADLDLIDYIDHMIQVERK